MNFFGKYIEPWLEGSIIRRDLFIVISIVLIAFILSNIVKKIIKFVIVKILKVLVKKTSGHLDNYIVDNVNFEKVSWFIWSIGFALMAKYTHYFKSFANIMSDLIVIFLITRIIVDILRAIINFTENDPKLQNKPYRSYIQVVIIVVYFIATITGLGAITGQSPWVLLSGISAFAAILMLVFKETILSFVSSVQISSYDLVRKNDWISVPKYEADGDVIEVALHTIKVRNWDKTISIVPTHDLMQSGYKNWRGMKETGGRRIKRAIYLDVSSIKFMDEKLRLKMGKVKLLQQYFIEIESEIDASYSANSDCILNENRLTNLGTFRVYVTEYLKSLGKLREDLTFLVRQLQPGPTGLPIEIYVFTATTEWTKYEQIQADIFDHLFAAVHEFELRAFQYPSGQSGFSPEQVESTKV